MTYILEFIKAARKHPRLTLGAVTAILAAGAMLWPDLPVDKITSLVAVLLGA